VTLFTVLAAFGGGIFGALIGGTAAFIFTGVLGLTGIAISVAGGGDIILNDLAFGFFGPHVSFVGAVAAAAYAGRISTKSKGQTTNAYSDFKSDYVIDGTDTMIPLFKTNNSIVLLIGGLFGVLGYLTHILYETILTLPLDTVALTVATYAVICRILFGTTGLFGKFPLTDKRFNITGNTLLFNTIWGFGIAVVVSYICILLDFNSVGFVISAISLIFVYFGMQFPVSHHVSMVAGFAALAFGNVLIGGIFGVLAVLTGDYVSRITNSYVDTHIDMPAIVITLWSFIILGVLS
jgi:hypothetical protein